MFNDWSALDSFLERIAQFELDLFLEMFDDDSNRPDSYEYVSKSPLIYQVIPVSLQFDSWELVLLFTAYILSNQQK